MGIWRDLLNQQGYDFIDFKPPAQIREIEDFEQALGFVMPEDLRSFYLEMNGAYSDNNGWPYPIVGSIDWVLQESLSFKQNRRSLAQFKANNFLILSENKDVPHWYIYVLDNSIKLGIYYLNHDYRSTYLFDESENPDAKYFYAHDGMLEFIETFEFRYDALEHYIDRYRNYKQQRSWQ